jgi:hypothetical protein
MTFDDMLAQIPDNTTVCYPGTVNRLKSPPPDRSRDLQHSCGATLPHPAARVQPQHEQRCAAPALAPGCPQSVAVPRWARGVSQAGGAGVLQRARSRGAGRKAF